MTGPQSVNAHLYFFTFVIACDMMHSLNFNTSSCLQGHPGREGTPGEKGLPVRLLSLLRIYVVFMVLQLTRICEYARF